MSRKVLASKVIIAESGPKIRGVASAPTSVVGAVGVAERGPTDKAILCTSFDDYRATFGGFAPGSDLALAAMGFFENGGSRLWASRIASDTAATASGELLGTMETGAATPAMVTGSTAPPFVFQSGDLLGVHLGSSSFGLTFEGTRAEIQSTAVEPYPLAEGATLVLEIDGGAEQTITFTSGQFADIGSATAQEIANAINPQLTGADAYAIDGRVRIRSFSRGTASHVEVTGGTGAAGGGVPPYIEGSTPLPLVLQDGDTLHIDVAGQSYDFTFEGAPAIFEDASDPPHVEPFVLRAGMTVVISIDGGEDQEIAFTSRQFVDMGAATAQEVVDAINSQLTGAVASVSSVGGIRITTLTTGNISNIRFPGGDAIYGETESAQVVGTVPFPLVLHDGDTLHLDVIGNSYDITFEGQPAVLEDDSESPRVEPFVLEDGMELILSIDGGDNQFITFTSGQFADITAATAQEVADAINAQLTDAVASPSPGGGVRIATISQGNQSRIRTIGGNAVNGDNEPASLVGTVPLPFVLEDGDTLHIDANGSSYDITFEGQPAVLEDDSETPRLEPFVLEDGMDLIVAIDHGDNQFLTFSSAQFVDISAATAQEVADAINAQLTDAVASPSPAGGIRITTVSRGTDSAVNVNGGSAVNGTNDPAEVVGTVPLPFVLQDGDTLHVDANGGSYDLTFEGAAAVLEDTSESPRLEPFVLEDGMGLIVQIDHGDNQFLTFTSGQFDDIAAATAAELADAINSQLTGAVASASPAGGIRFTTVSKGTDSAISINGGSSVNGDDEPAEVVGTVPLPFVLDDGDILHVEANGHAYDLTFEGTPASVQDTSESPSVEPFELADGNVLIVAVDYGDDQFITFTTGQFDDISAATASEVCAAINAQLTGAIATPSAGAIVITTVSKGTDSRIVVGSGTADTTLGLHDASSDGTGNVDNLLEVTVDDIWSLVTAAGGDADFDINDLGTGLQLVTMPAFTGSSVTIQVSGTAVTAMGLDTNVHHGFDADRLGILFASASGTGNVDNLLEVTVDDIWDLVTAVGGDTDFDINDVGTGLQLVTMPAFTGSSVTIQVSGTAVTAMGLDTNVHHGFDADRLGIMYGAATGTGNVDDLLEVTVDDIWPLITAIGADEDIDIDDVETGLQIATRPWFFGSAVTLQVSGTAVAAMGLDTAVHHGFDADRLGFAFGAPDGSGNVPNLLTFTTDDLGSLFNDAGVSNYLTTVDTGAGVQLITLPWHAGASASIQLSGTAVAEMGFDTLIHHGFDADRLGFAYQGADGSGNVQNLLAVTAGDLSSMFNGTASNYFYTEDTGSGLLFGVWPWYWGSSVSIQVSGTAAIAMGFDNDVHVGFDLDLTGFAYQNEAGDGNVGNIAAVTVAEVAAIAANAGGLIQAHDLGTSIQLATTATGASASLRVTGVASTIMGLDHDVHRGTDGVSISVPVVHVEALGPGASGNGLSVQIDPLSNGNFDLVVYADGEAVETFQNLSRDRAAPRFIEGIVNNPQTGSKIVRVTDSSDLPGDAPEASTYALAGGDDGTGGLTDADFIGDEDAGTGLHAFDAVGDLTLLLVPGRATPAVHNAMLAYCEEIRDGSVFAVLDPPERARAAADMVTYVTTTASLENASEYGAIYWPRVTVLNPDKSVFGPSDQIVVPPSGIIAGVYARTDAARPGGVYTQPAGIDAGQLFGVLGFASGDALKERKRDLVYPHRINPLTTGPGLPMFIDGSRTLKGDGSFPFVAERRGVTFIERTLKQELQSVRHRSNTSDLRAQVRRTITGFLITQMNNGAFRSYEPSKAFYVDVSDQLNPPSVVRAGKLMARIGLATNKPAEFVTLEISQDTRAFDARLGNTG